MPRIPFRCPMAATFGSSATPSTARNARLLGRYLRWSITPSAFPLAKTVSGISITRSRKMRKAILTVFSSLSRTMGPIIGRSMEWITLLCVRNMPNSNAFALGFEICGTDLAHVANLDKDPQQWSVSYFPLVADGVHAYPSASTVIDGDFLNILTLDEKGKRPEILTRIPLSGLDAPQKNLEYLGADGSWHPGLEPAKAKTVMNAGASEMSVRYHPELKKWIAVHVDATIFSDKVLLRTAPSLTGPWTDGEVIYKIPELQKSTEGYDPDTFCYAGKEHPEFEQPGELVFTYVCNTMKPKKLETLNIYFPKVIRMPMPASATEPAQ